MRKLQQLGALALAALLIVSSAPLLTAADDVSVGQFVQRIAAAKNLEATDSFVAADSLSRAGVQLPAGIVFSNSLREADVVVIARSLGINVRSGDPDATFGDSQVDRFFLSFSRELTAAGTEEDNSASSTPDYDLFDDLVQNNPGNGDGDVTGDWFWWWKGWFPGYWWSKWQDHWSGKWKGKWKGKGKGGKKTPKDPH